MNFLYQIYCKILQKKVLSGQLPKHIGVILDGNRRWSNKRDKKPKKGHQAGAKKIFQFLEWSNEFNISNVTLWLLSTANLDREELELKDLLSVIENTVVQLVNSKKWKINIIGNFLLLPEKTRKIIQNAKIKTASNDSKTNMVVNVAIGYGGKDEILNAIKQLLLNNQESNLKELAMKIKENDIEKNLYINNQPDPDLVIRTSGEQRLSGFLLWQSANSEVYFCEAYWPDFRKVDYLRALRDFSTRNRRFGL